MTDRISYKGAVYVLSYYYDPLVTDLVSMSNEQMRFVLDNADEFLLHDVDDYIPEGAKKNFEDWNPPDGHVTGKVQVQVQKIALKQTLPAKDYPLRGIEKGTPAHKMWSELMDSDNFRQVLKSKPPQQQWAIAHHAHVLKCRKNKVKPFSWWTPEHKSKFETKLKKIHNNIHHKSAFKKRSGETPEQHRKRTGKCPRHFVWVGSRKRCIHKDSV